MLKQLSLAEFHEAFKNTKIIYPPIPFRIKGLMPFVSVLEIPFTPEVKVQVKMMPVEEDEIDIETKKIRGISDDEVFGIPTELRVVGDTIKEEDLHDILPQPYAEALYKVMSNVIRMCLPISTELISIRLYKYFESIDDKAPKDKTMELLDVVNTILYKLKRAKLYVMTYDTEYDTKDNIDFVLNSFAEIDNVRASFTDDLRAFTDDEVLLEQLTGTILDSYALQGINYTLSPQEYRKRLQDDYKKNELEGKHNLIMLVHNALRSIMVKEDEQTWNVTPPEPPEF